MKDGMLLFHLSSYLWVYKKNLIMYKIPIIFLIAILTGCNFFSEQKKSEQSVHKESTDSIKILKKYDEFGNLKQEIPVKDKKRHGIVKQYYNDGSLHSEISYVNNIKNGLTKWYYKSGELYRETHYVDGKIDGMRKFYHRNGQLKAEIPYKDGEQIPGIKEYTTSGTLVNQPEMIFWVEDNLKESNSAVLKVRLSNQTNNVTFYQYTTDNATNRRNKSILITQSGIGEIPIYVKKGYAMDKEINVYAETKSGNGYPLILKSTYHLKLENN